MSVKISGHTEPHFRTRVTHEPSGSHMHTVAPKDNGGDGSTFSPTDLIAVALASCVATTADLYAQKHSLDLKKVSFTAEKEMATSIPRRVSKLKLNIVFEGRLSAENFEKLKTAAGRCPVKLSLHPEVMVEEKFTYIEI
jgi:putative redox protein